MRTGEVFLITSEEYDSYGIRTVLRAVRDFDLDEQVKLFVAAHPIKKDDHGYEDFNSQAFVAWLHDHALVVEEKELLEVHLGAYGYVPKDLEKDAHERKGRFLSWRHAWPWG
jgi:hypothetical protein